MRSGDVIGRIIILKVIIMIVMIVAIVMIKSIKKEDMVTGTTEIGEGEIKEIKGNDNDNDCSINYL